MDCEKFENLLIDELYGELDEVTSAAVRRHAAGCARCGALLSGLKATRKVAALPVEQPSIDLEDRILAAVREQQKVLPFRARMSTALSRAGAWAMRPQTAMAAVFLVVIGTSFVLVQSRKGMAPSISARALNAEGQPVPAAQGAVAATAAASALALESKEGAFAHGIEDREQQRAHTITAAPSSLAEAIVADDLSKDKNGTARSEEKKAESGYARPTANPDGIANAGPIGGAERNDSDNRPGASNMRGGGSAGSGGAVQSQATTPPMQQAPAATTTTAQSRVAINCQQYDANRAQGGPAGNAATLDAGRCYKQLGNAQLARQRFASLAGTPLAPVAQNELDSMTPLAARKAMPHANATTATPTATVQAAPPVKADANTGL